MSLWPSPDEGWQDNTTATTPRTKSFYANPNLYNVLISDLCSVGLGLLIIPSSQGCLHIGDEALYNLARYCPNLENVNFQGCRNIQDDGTVALFEGCPSLHYVCISNCSHLTDQSIVSLATNCPGLVTLECAGLSLLTDTGFIVRHLSSY